MAQSDAPANGGKASVGKLQGNKVYELFTTDRCENQMTASDLSSLYFARGGFEQTLSLEDQEQHPDRFCSQNLAGQEFWQIISQWIWNVRLRLVRAGGVLLRLTGGVGLAVSFAFELAGAVSSCNARMRSYVS